MSGRRTANKRGSATTTTGDCCCMATYGDSASSEVEKIMLRFRPIAPKPAASSVRPNGDAFHTSSHPMLDGNISGSGGLGRRRKCASAAAAAGGGLLAGRGASAERGRRRKLPAPDYPVSVAQAIDDQLQKWVAAAVGSGLLSGQTAHQPSAVSTLPLLPERPEHGISGQQLPAASPLPMTHISLPTNIPQFPGDALYDYYVSPRKQPVHEEPHRPPAPPTATAVVVESASVGEASVDAGMWLCWCDEEQARWGLHADASPAFLSDAYGKKITWANAAFRVIVHAAGSGSDKRLYSSLSPDVPDLVSMRWAENLALPPTGWSAFSCRVTVRRASASLTAPCDVWRLVDGAMAWRLDVDAALSLRR